MSAHKLKKKTALLRDSFNNNEKNDEESDEDLPKGGRQTNMTGSYFDIENQNENQSSQRYLDQGYRLLPEHSDEDKSSGRRPAGKPRSNAQILEPPGRGHKALDSSHEADTDEERDDEPTQRSGALDSDRDHDDDSIGLSRRPGAIRDPEGHYMKPIYSTRQLTTDLSKPKGRERSPYDSDEHHYASNYDGDEFEDNTDDHEFDDNGDFELPENHSQNIDATEPNIKLQIKASKNKSATQSNQFTASQVQNQKRYQSTGTGTDFTPLKGPLLAPKTDAASAAKQEPPKIKKKNKASNKKGTSGGKAGNKQLK